MFVLVCEVHCEQKCEGSAVDFFGVFHPLCRRFLKMVNCKEQRCLMPKSQPEVRCFRTWNRCVALWIWKFMAVVGYRTGEDTLCLRFILCFGLRDLSRWFRIQNWDWKVSLEIG
ncbi:hypothetical protein Droror1_Dr00016083 [Drosera rotundifolia]